MEDRRGIALPLTIFIITLLTIMLAAAFARVGAEREISVGASESVGALTVAQSGLQQYLGSRTTRPPDGDSLRFNVTGGYADVVARIVQRPADSLQTHMYIVRSTGYVIVPALGANPQGRRTVAQFAQWQVPVIRRIAAYVAANGARDQVPGNRVVVNGTDCGSAAPIGSIRASTGSNLTRGTYTPAPPVVAAAPAFLADTTGVDWAAIVGGAFTPDYHYINTADLNYKSHMVVGDASLNNVVGRGLLIVTGDLTMAGVSAGWQGIVLVGGKIAFANGTKATFDGLVFSGLNTIFVGPPPQNTVLGGSAGPSWFHFNYCSTYVDATLAAFSRFAPTANAWVDNWASY